MNTDKFKVGNLYSSSTINKFTMSKKTKTKLVLVIQYKYGNNSWEDVCEYGLEDYNSRLEMEKSARVDLKEYNFREPGCYRLINRRIKND